MTIQSSHWRDRRVVLLNGSGETRKGTQRAYQTISLGEVFDAADSPTAVEKPRARAIIPSSYALADARTFAAQRENGTFPLLTADIDKGNVSLEHLESAVDSAFGGRAASMIYSTSSATAGDNKWRVLAPLSEPASFEIWERAQLAFCDLLREHGIVPDETLCRAGQLVYLPNVPPGRRRENGEPNHYSYSVTDGPAVDLSRQPLAGAMQSLAEASQAAEAKWAAERTTMAIKRAKHNAFGSHSPIARFNAENSLEDVLIKFGYQQKHPQSPDWRSPLQNSGSFATRVCPEPGGASWISLSGSDANAGLGAPSALGNRFGDAFDLFVHFEHNGDRVSALAAITKEYVTKSNVEHIVAQPYRPRNPLDIPPRRWVVDRLLLGGTVTVLTAPGGSGKTTFTIGLALSIATGKPILDMTVWEPDNVWVWNLEDDLDELDRLILAAQQHHGLEHEEVSKRVFVNSGLDGSELCTATEARDGMTLLQPVFDRIRDLITQNEIRVLIIDPFVSSHAVEENSNTKIDKIAKAWARVARATACAIILVHHTSKAGAGDVSSASARGASALTSAARGVIVINKMPADAARSVGVPDTDRWRYFSVQDDKHSRAPAEQARWFEIVPVTLANGDNVGVASPWQIPSDVPLYSNDDVRAVQALAASNRLRRDFRATDWIGHAIGRVIGLDSYDRVNRVRLDRIARDWIHCGYFAIEKGQDKGRKDREYLIPGVVPASLADAIAGECGS